MKPFDIALARQGMPVITRDGRYVTILTTELEGTDRPVCAAICDRDAENLPHEYTLQYFADGRLVKRWVPTKECSRELRIEDRPEDLFME